MRLVVPAVCLVAFVLTGCDACSALPYFGHGRRVSASAIAELQKWADDHGARNELEWWVIGSRGVIWNSGTSFAVEYGPGRTHRTATVTLVQDGFDDDSVRGTREVFEFTRGSCTRCPGGVTPWTLVSLEIVHRCWEGRGHEDYSAEPCD